MKKLLLLCVLVLGVAAFSQAQDNSLGQYAGKYKFPDGSTWAEADVAVNGQNLTITAPAGPTNMTHVSGDVFSMGDQGTVEFVRNASKKVVGLKIKSSSLSLEGQRREQIKKPLLKHPLLPLRMDFLEGSLGCTCR